MALDTWQEIAEGWEGLARKAARNHLAAEDQLERLNKRLETLQVKSVMLLIAGLVAGFCIGFACGS